MRMGLILLGILVCGLATGQPARMWSASPWEHIRRDAKGRSQVFARLSAAANEYEACRFIVTAGEQPATVVDLTVGDLKHPGGPIGADNIRVYREHYINCSEPSYRSTAEPGWYPDPLIPLVDPVSGEPLEGAEYDAIPCTIDAGTSQGFWVDIYVPKGTRPGVYEGAITMALADGTNLDAPITLTVWDFELPDTFAMRSNFGSLGRGVAQGIGMEADSDGFRRVEDLYIDEMLAHRCQPSTLGRIWPDWTEDGGVDDSQSGDRLRTMVEDRHINSLMLPFPWGSGPDKCKAELHDLAAYLREKGWLDLAYVYMEDEPNDAEQYETVRQQGALIHEADPGIKRLCTEQTITSNEEWGNLYGAVDIWCPLWGLYDEETARQRQALGEEIWSYTALCQCDEKNPFWQIDFPPVDFRAPFWVSWHYGIKGFLYWSSVYWPPDHDPWTAPHFRDQYWGEGMLLYPGQPAGIDGPVTSIRLKLIRDAMEDFEYMALAAKEGKRDQVNAIVGRLARSFTDWERDPEAYMTARAELAALIE